jgi:hypothetical protein
MRVLILGLPGSGTSCVADIYHRAGFFGGEPYFAKGAYPYPTHESLLGRAVNRIVLGGAHRDWPSWRWHDDYRPRNPYSDPEVFAFGDWFVEYMDAHGDWFFKNPESLLTWTAFWRRFRWDEVIGVYRHPEEAVRVLHSTQKACYRRAVWNRYARRLVQAATRTVRFPDDMPALAQELGVECPFNPQLRKTRVDYDPSGSRWCQEWWTELEGRRCPSMTEMAI